MPKITRPLGDDRDPAKQFTEAGLVDHGGKARNAGGFDLPLKNVAGINGGTVSQHSKLEYAADQLPSAASSFQKIALFQNAQDGENVRWLDLCYRAMAEPRRNNLVQDVPRSLLQAHR